MNPKFLSNINKDYDFERVSEDESKNNSASTSSFADGSKQHNESNMLLKDNIQADKAKGKPKKVSSRLWEVKT